MEYKDQLGILNDKKEEELLLLNKDYSFIFWGMMGSQRSQRPFSMALSQQGRTTVQCSEAHQGYCLEVLEGNEVLEIKRGPLHM